MGCRSDRRITRDESAWNSDVSGFREAVYAESKAKPSTDE
jgi:hypothetical protein